MENQEDEDDDSGFILITRRHKLCIKKQNHRSNKSISVNTDPTSKSSQDILKNIMELKDKDFVLKYSSDLYTCLMSTCSSDTGISVIICYGIGRISEDPSAQYQLAVLLGLIEIMKVKQVWVYDPVLCDEELTVLDKLGLRLIMNNEMCKRPAHCPTLFYMIHCDKEMYNNLLYSNWNPSLLVNVIIIGNRFSNYYLRLTDHQLHDGGYYMLKIKGSYNEECVPRFKIPNVFNDTAVHTFPFNKLLLLEDSVWSNRPEPSSLEQIDESSSRSQN